MIATLRQLSVATSLAVLACLSQPGSAGETEIPDTGWLTEKVYVPALDALCAGDPARLRSVTQESLQACPRRDRPQSVKLALAEQIGPLASPVGALVFFDYGSDGAESEISLGRDQAKAQALLAELPNLFHLRV